jgi:hypothetical protein
VDFQVISLSCFLYRFSVFSKDVGLLIYKLGFVKCRSFDVFFLWSSSGPNWEHDSPTGFMNKRQSGLSLTVDHLLANLMLLSMRMRHLDQSSKDLNIHILIFQIIMPLQIRRFVLQLIIRPRFVLALCIERLIQSLKFSKKLLISVVSVVSSVIIG